MNEQDLRDVFAMFAMNGLLHPGNAGIWQSKYEAKCLAEFAYVIADAMVEARKPKETVGLPAIKRKTRAKNDQAS